MKDIIIFGAGRIAEAITYYIERDNTFRIHAYVVEREFQATKEFLGKPVIPLEKTTELFPADIYGVLVAVGYQGMNLLRTDKLALFRKMGYSPVSFISSEVNGDFTVGENSVVMDDVIIQPKVEIGDNVFVWGGAMIGHHARIGNNCWITGSAAIGGVSTVGEGCFVGLNATIGNEITIGDRCMIGAGTLVTKNLPDESVLITKDTEKHRLNSTQFSRMSSCFRI